MRAVEHHDPGLLQHRRHLVRATRVVVVVAEHRQDRDVEVAHGVGEDRGLLRLAVRREVAGQQDEVHLTGQRAERSRARSRSPSRPKWTSPAAAIRIRHSRARAWADGWGLSSSLVAGTHVAMASDEQPFADIEHALKRAAAALREADLAFLLGGSLASWARGGPETRHDLDLMIKPQDVERALAALEAAGMRPERPPEDWLVKAWDGDTLVDLIYCPKGLPMDDDVIARGEELSVLGMEIRVMALEDVMATKLMALTEHSLRYEGLLQIARALREQIDWDAVRSRTEQSPFARAFFVLLEGLDILPGPGPCGAARTPACASSHRRVPPRHREGRRPSWQPPRSPASICAGWQTSSRSVAASSPSS